MAKNVWIENATPNLEAQLGQAYGVIAKNQLNRLLTIAEAAELLGLRPSTLRAWVLRRRIRVVRVGRRAIRVPLSVIQELVEIGTIPAREPRQ